MPDPVWLDTSTLIDALMGDPKLNDQLSQYRRSGRQLLVTERVETEILDGNALTQKSNKDVVKQVPDSKTREQVKKGMDKIGVEVDREASKIPPATRENYKKSIKHWGNVSDSDRIVLSEIKASAEQRKIAAPEIITSEVPTKGLQKWSSEWGIKSISAVKSPSSPVTPNPRVNLADYPEDPPAGESKFSRYFKDRPILKKLGLIGGTIAAQQISSMMVSEVFDHYKGVLADAGKAFEVNHPDLAQIRSKSRIDDYKRAYEKALSSVNQQTNLKAAEAFILAFTPNRDIDKTKAFLDAQIARVASVADGRLIGFAQAAQEYIDAMVSLYKQIAAASMDLPEIAADVEKRGKVVFGAGSELDTTFWEYAPAAASFPFAYYEWLNVKSLADSFITMGSSLRSFAGQISARYSEYETAMKGLDNELMKVGEQAAKF
jgi:hypothetical protein